MNRLEELLEELCPEGVVLSKIDELCTITRGRVMSKDYILANQGEYPVYSSQTENNGELGKISTFDYEGEYLTWTTDGANAGSIFYRNGKFSVTNVCGLLNIKFDKILIRYLYYSLLVTAPKHVSRGMGNPKLMSAAMAKIKIPVPPIEVQNEIVRILDRYTELNTKLISELRTELEARRNQYECYRDEFLTFGEEVGWKKLIDFGTVIRGNGLQKKDFRENGVGCIHYGQIYTHFGTVTNKTKTFVSPELSEKLKTVNNGDLVIAVTSENIEDVCKCVAWLGDEEIVTGGHSAIFKHNENPKYLAYYFQIEAFAAQKRRIAIGTKVIEVYPSKLGNIKIQLPSLEEQQRIVEILEKYENLYKDISTQIKAEVESRQKQYDYYRNKLLTFKIKE